MHPSVVPMWAAYVAAHPGTPALPVPPAWHFCGNEPDADTCAALVLAGRKRSTAPSLWSYESSGETPPKAGDVHIVTDWAGVAQCIIRITDVRVVAFRFVDAAHAAAEGEGDGSLEHWRRTHWDYYHRELAGTKYVPADDMPVVCEYFEMVYAASMMPTSQD